MLLLASACRDDGVVVHAEPPLINIFEPSDGSEFYEDQQIEFRAQLDTVDGTPLDDLTHRWVSGNITLCEEVSSPSDGIALCVTSFPDAGDFSVTATAKTPFNERSTDTVEITINYNEPPEVELVSPADGSIFQDASFVVFEATMWDPEDEADQLYVTLVSNIDGDLGVNPYGSTSGDWTDAVSNLSDGTHLITIAVEDSAGKTAQDSITLRAGNTPPGVDSCNIEPSPLFTLDDADCVPSGWADAEGDPEKYTYRWWHNGIEDTGQTSSVYPYSNTIKGDQLQCELTAYDEYDVGESVTSPTATVKNSPPSDPVIAIQPASPEPEDNLLCAVTGGSTDDDGDGISYTYAWYKNGTLIGSEVGSVLAFANTSHGESWECQVRAFDGENYSGTVSASDTVMDQTAPNPPTINSLAAYSNDEDINLVGTCEALCDLTFYFSDSTGTWSESATCASDSTYSYASYVTRGYSTSIYATCEDAAGNVSNASNTVTTETCDPEDTNEANGGDTSGTAISLTALPDNNTVTVTATGNAPTTSDQDWFTFTASNAQFQSSNINPFNLDIELTDGSSNFTIDVYKGSTSAPLCTSGVTDFNYYQSDPPTTGAKASPAHSPSSKQACAPNLTTDNYNECKSFNDTYLVKVTRNTGSGCEDYELTITNGGTAP